MTAGLSNRGAQRGAYNKGGAFMSKESKHKLYIGYGGFMLRIPPVLSEKGARRGEKGAKANAAILSKVERSVHHFIVRKMAVVKDPITTELIADEMKLPNDQVLDIVDKLEKLKTFVFRSDGKGIDWAYPLSLEDTGFRITASSGEQFFGA